MKKIIIVMLCILSILVLFACDNEALPKSTSTPANTDIATTQETTSEPTAEPTKEPTPEPAATIEPGKETYAGEVDSSSGANANLTPTTGTIKDEMITDNLAAQFFATTSFNQIDINCVSYGNDIGTLVISLYRWMGSYFATIEETPVDSEEFVDFKDNSILQLKLKEEMPDGEYIIFLHTEGPEEGVGVYTNQDVVEGKTRLYKNDELIEKSGLYMAIHYTKTPENILGPIQDPGF